MAAPFQERFYTRPGTFKAPVEYSADRLVTSCDCGDPSCPLRPTSGYAILVLNLGDCHQAAWRIGRN